MDQHGGGLTVAVSMMKERPPAGMACGGTSETLRLNVGT